MYHYYIHLPKEKSAVNVNYSSLFLSDELIDVVEATSK